MIESGFSFGRYEGMRMRSLEYCKATSNLQCYDNNYCIFLYETLTIP